jgi:hypothetical protein
MRKRSRLPSGEEREIKIILNNITVVQSPERLSVQRWVKVAMPHPKRTHTRVRAKECPFP